MDTLIPFLGAQVRVTGYPRDELRGVLEGAGFVVEAESVRSYAPAAAQAPPEVQLFSRCRLDN